MRLFQKSSVRRVVVGIADIHSGHRLGLLNPDTVLVRERDDGSDEEWSPELSETQKYLWRLYQQNIQQLLAFAGKDEIVVVHNGDATQGDAHGGTIPDVTRADQRTIAKFNLLPLARLPQVRLVRLVTGTEVHVPESAEAKVAWSLRQETGKDVAACHHSRIAVSGVLFDLAHHGPFPGSRDWLKGNVAFYYLKDHVYQDRRLGRCPARVYMRAHYHDYVPVRFEEFWAGERHIYDLTVLPSFAGMTRYAAKATRSKSSLTNGVVCYEIVDGRLGRIEPFMETLDLRTEEVI